MPTVTTIIPAYNAAQYIRGAIDSALRQSHRDQEVIVVDDGSTDNTPHVLSTYGERIRVVSQANSGHIVARNNAAKMASGEWLAFLDADDEWLPGKLTAQLALAKGQVAMVYTDRENFGETSGRVGQFASDSGVLCEGDIFETLLLDNFITASSVIIRRGWFDRLGGFDPALQLCEDWDLWLRFAANGGLARVCSEPLTRYRWHASSMSNQHDRMRQGRLQVLRRALKSPRGRKTPGRTVRHAIANVWECSAWWVQPRHRWKAARWYMRSACYRPTNTAAYKGIAKCILGIE